MIVNEIIPLNDDPIPLYLSVVLGRGSSVIGTPMHLYLLDILQFSKCNSNWIVLRMDSMALQSYVNDISGIHY